MDNSKCAVCGQEIHYDHDWEVWRDHDENVISLSPEEHNHEPVDERS